MKSPRIQPRSRRCIPEVVLHASGVVVRRGREPDVDLEADQVRGDLALRPRDGRVALGVAAELAITLTTAGRGRGPAMGWAPWPARRVQTDAPEDSAAKAAYRVLR